MHIDNQSADLFVLGFCGDNFSRATHCCLALSSVLHWMCTHHGVLICDDICSYVDATDLTFASSKASLFNLDGFSNYGRQILLTGGMSTELEDTGNEQLTLARLHLWHFEFRSALPADACVFSARCSSL